MPRSDANEQFDSRIAASGGVTAAQPIQVLPLGDAALTVEFGNEINPTLNERVIAFADALRAQSWPGVRDIVPTYRSVTIHVDPLCLDVNTLSDRLLQLSRNVPMNRPFPGARHRIPVLYGGEWGPDLEELAVFAKLAVEDAVRLHMSVEYRVYLLGFSPGFPYLGIVPAPLAMPRLATPRTVVPAGSVGIAGSQTGIYPTATPGGWRLIGRTPLTLYRPADAKPFLLSPGDLVRFEPIDPEEFERLHCEQDDDAH
jgi:KipI family sensor histidine kinase inhibitor